MLSRGLLSDAEMSEHVFKYGFCLYLATGNLTEVVQAAAEVLTYKVGGEAGGKAVDDTGYVFMSQLEGCKVTDIAHDNAICGLFRQHERCAQEIAQLFNTCTALGRNA